MTKQQIKLALSIIRPAIRALTGQQKIRMIGYSDVYLNSSSMVIFKSGTFFIVVGNEKYRVQIYSDKIGTLKEI